MENAQPPLPDDPNELPYPGHARELAALQAKAQAAARSRSVALPGPTREAFAGSPRRLHGFTFQPVCAWLVAILTRIESPLLDILAIYRERAEALRAAAALEDAEARTAELKRLQAMIAAEIDQLEVDPEASLDTVFAFITPVEQLQGLLDAEETAYRRAARLALGKLHPSALADLERACGEHYSASFTTVLQISPQPQEGTGGADTFFFRSTTDVDGIGWWLEIVGCLMHDFRMSYPTAMTFPLVRAFALVAYAQLRNPFCSMEIDGDGYLAQEANKTH